MPRALQGQMTEAREKVRTEALAFLEQVMTLTLQVMVENDGGADPDDPDWSGPAIQQFRDNLLYLGVTSDELDAAGIKEDGEPQPQPNRDELVRRIAAERSAHPLIQLPGDQPAITSGDIGRAIDTVQAVRNQFEPSYALVEFSEALIAQLMAVRRGAPWPVPEVAHADGPDADCPHMEFEAGVTVQRILGDNLVVAGFWAEVMVACTGCDEVFRWTGVQPGLSPAGPRVSIDHRTLHAPFHRASRDPDEGQGLPGFDVNIIGPELGHERTAAAIRRRALEDAAELVKGRQTPVVSIAARRELRRAEAELRRLALATP